VEGSRQHPIVRGGPPSPSRSGGAPHTGTAGQKDLPSACGCSRGTRSSLTLFSKADLNVVENAAIPMESSPRRTGAGRRSPNPTRARTTTLLPPCSRACTGTGISAGGSGSATPRVRFRALQPFRAHLQRAERRFRTRGQRRPPRLRGPWRHHSSSRAGRGAEESRRISADRRGQPSPTTYPKPPQRSTCTSPTRSPTHPAGPSWF